MASFRTGIQGRRRLNGILQTLFFSELLAEDSILPIQTLSLSNSFGANGVRESLVATALPPPI